MGNKTFKKAFSTYKTHHQSNNGGGKTLVNIEIVNDILQEHFPFDVVNCIETGGSHNWNDGMAGLYFCLLSNLTNGRFHSVDNDSSIHDKVINAFKKVDPTLMGLHTTSDSIAFLNEIDFIPNLLFLDSWDLNLYNPFPSAVHTLREFLAMEDKMLVGSIIIIDDNYFSNFHNPTWVDCHNADESIERITLPYPVIGKGSNIYAWVDTAIDCPWKFLSSNPDIPGACNVIVIQKQ
jgi:hypothetical protein